MAPLCFLKPPAGIPPLTTTSAGSTEGVSAKRFGSPTSQLPVGGVIRPSSDSSRVSLCVPCCQELCDRRAARRRQIFTFFISFFFKRGEFVLPVLICCLVHARSRDPGAEGMLLDLVSQGKGD